MPPEENLPTLTAVLAQASAPPSDAPHHFVITLVSDGLLETVAGTDHLGLQADRLQHELREGPCLAPPGQDTVLVSQDLSGDPRWPRFGSACVALTGLRSLLTVHLPLAGDRQAALTFYSESRAAFDGQDAVAAATLARLAPDVEALAGQGRTGQPAIPAVDTCGMIGKALNVVASRYRVDSAQALEMLTDASRVLDCRMLDLASSVVLNGRLPAREIWRARRERLAAGRDAATGHGSPLIGYRAS